MFFLKKKEKLGHVINFIEMLVKAILFNKTFFFFSYEGLRLRQPQTENRVVLASRVRQSAPAALQPVLNALPLPTGPEIRSPRHRPEGQFSFKPHSIACRRRSVLPSLAAPSCRCRPSGEAGTSVPITIGTWTRFPSRAKRNL